MDRKERARQLVGIRLRRLAVDRGPTRGEVTDRRQPVPTIVGRVRAAARPHLSRGSRSGGFHESEVVADLRDHGLLGEVPEPNAEAMLGVRAARADLLGHAYWDLPSHRLD